VLSLTLSHAGAQCIGARKSLRTWDATVPAVTRVRRVPDARRPCTEDTSRDHELRSTVGPRSARRHRRGDGYRQRAWDGLQRGGLRQDSRGTRRPARGRRRAPCTSTNATADPAGPRARSSQAPSATVPPCCCCCCYCWRSQFRPRPRPRPRPIPLPLPRPAGLDTRFCTSFGVSSTSRVSRLMLSGRM